MKVLITGATGFIGSNLVYEFLKNGYEVFRLVRQSSVCEDLNTTDIVYNENLDDLILEFKKYKFDLVIHCAAYFVAEHKTNDVDNLIKSNILLTTHILEAMKESGVKKLINTSTSWQHYNNEPYNPVCLYAATKQSAEDIIRFYCEAGFIDSVTLTIYDSFGPNDKRKKLIKLLEDVLKNRSTLAMSPGEQYLDYIYIDDITDAYLLSAEKLFKEEFIGFNKYYLNSDNPLKLKEIVKTYEDVFESKMNITFGERPYRQREVMTTYQKGQRLPGWYPKYSFREGLEKIKNENGKSN